MKTLKNLTLLLVIISSALYAQTNSNPNVFIPSVSSDFTAPNPANANKIWSIQQNFDLTAGNFNVPTGVELSFEGGSLITTGTVTFDKTVIAAQNYKQIFDVGDVSGTVKGDVVVNWFGLVGDGITDNRSTLLKAAKIVNASGGTAYVYNDTDNVYAVSVVSATVANVDEPSNIVIKGEGTSWRGISNASGQPKFKIIGHNLSGSELFATFKHNNGFFENIAIIGERDEHTYSGSGADERNHNFVVASGTRNLTIKNCTFSKSEADGLYFINHYVFTNQHTTLQYTQGNIAYADGSTEVDEGYMYSNVLFPVSSAAFTDIGKFSLTGDDYGTLFTPRIFHAVYYDATSAFIGKSDVLEWFDEVEIPENCTQVRIVIPYTAENLTLRVSAPYIAQNTQVLNSRFLENSRQHISNPGQNSKILYNYFDTVGPKLPGRAIDLEDLYQGLRHHEIAYNTFKNSSNGDIITKSCEYLNFHHNTLLPNDKFAFSDGNNASTEGTGIQVRKSFQTRVDNNTLHGRVLSVGYGGTAKNNIIREGAIVIANEETTVDGGQFFNVQILPTTGFLEGNAYLKNAKFFFEKPFEEPIFKHEGELSVFNTVFDFNGKSDYNGSVAIALLTSLKNDPTPIGVWDRVTVQNLEVDDAFKWIQGIGLYAHDFYNFKSSVPLDVRFGNQRDLLFKNLDLKGRFRLRLDDFPEVGSVFSDVVINNLYLDVDNANYTNNFAYPFQVEAKDVNLYVKDSKIKTVTGVLRLIKLKNKGVKVFENVVFDSADPLFIDLDIMAEGAGVTFINCVFLNVSVELRAQDQIINPDGTVIKGSDTYIANFDTVSDLPTTFRSTINYAIIESDPVFDNRGLYAIINGSWKHIYHFSNPKLPAYKSFINEIDNDSPDIEDGLAFVNGGNGTVVDVNRYLSNYIPVKKGDRLGRTQIQTYRLYDRSGTAILFADAAYGGSNNSKTVEIKTDNVAFIRWSGLISNRGITDMVVKEYNKTAGADPVSWAKYGGWKKSKFYDFREEGEIFEKNTNNLFNFQDGDYNVGYTGIGTLATNVGSTDFIRVKPSTYYTHNHSGSLNVTFWNESKTFISGGVFTKALSPSNAAYMSVQIPRSIPDIKLIEVTQGKNRGDGVYSDYEIDSNVGNAIEVTLIGDSTGAEDSTFATESSYASVSNNALGVETLHNISASGKAMRNFAQNINGGAQSLPSTSDLYLIALGTNDFGFNRPLGTLNVGSSPDNFYGSINKVVTDIETVNPNAKIVFITPIKRSNGETANVSGHVLEDYVNAIIKYAVSNDYEYLDLYNVSGIDPYKANLKTLYFVNTDGLHPNNEGHRIFMYPHVVKFLQTQIHKL